MPTLARTGGERKPPPKKNHRQNNKSNKTDKGSNSYSVLQEQNSFWMEFQLKAAAMDHNSKNTCNIHFCFTSIQLYAIIIPYFASS